MSISQDYMSWLASPKRKPLFLCLFSVLLAGLSGGCASMFDVSEKAQSDSHWKQYDPEWQSPTSHDPRPQWDILGIWPRDTQYP